MKKTLIAAALLSASTLATAGEPYVKDSDGNYVRDSWGECVRSIDWTPDAGACPAVEKAAPAAKAEAAAPAAAAPTEKPAAAAPYKGDIDGSGTSAYWVDYKQRVVRDNFGGCVRTIHWTKETAIAECEGWKKPEPKPAPVIVKKPEPASVVAKPAPAVEEPPPVFRGLFKTNSAELSDDAFGKLDLIVNYMKKYPAKKIIIKGYTDPRGSAQYNLKLSERRAEAVKDYLVKNGIDASRIEVQAFGETQLVCTDMTPECLQMNRRVEIEFVK
ncbi:Outer membrane protein OmpA [Sulfurivirga caldicuralii]|uniref:Outer membrane protein OmpA n=1 Tax=Sulfurivirga caldicuralii TaxID=364032 RepID=A0A1N6DNW9_9GAMM|nr:OmpA family protein [Sulfurivirga caldicuralii]SIN72374.1 Outer membrane protein OmpA [Sulfurivirga caldicuralii]